MKVRYTITFDIEENDYEDLDFLIEDVAFLVKQKSIYSFVKQLNSKCKDTEIISIEDVS